MKINDFTIKINRFGPLENVSFKLAPLMVFTGLSSTGKSYANYLVYYFLSRVCNGSLSNLVGEKIASDKDSQKYTFSLDSFLMRLSVNVQNFMQKFLGDDDLKCDVQFTSSMRKRTFSFQIERKELEEDENGMLSQSHTYTLNIEDGQSFQQSDFSLLSLFAAYELRRYILGEGFFRSVIFPPGRGAFAGENYTFKQDVGSSLEMYNSFFFDYDYGLRFHGRRGLDTNDDLSRKLLDMTSGGQLLSVEDKQYIKIDENHRLALSASASSVKDLSPWLFYLKNPIGTHIYCLEEPEAHQHPSVTVQIADTIAVSLNRGNGFHLTTHSDYLLQRLNQLVKLGGIRKKNEALFKRICSERHLDEQCYIDAQSVHAYYFSKKKDGKTKVETLKVDDDGIPMKSFFDVVRDLNDREEYIADAIYELSKEQDD